MDAASTAQHRRSWTPIGETSNQLIVYHPPSHAIEVVPHPRRASSEATSTRSLRLQIDGASDKQNDDTQPATCPVCGRSQSPAIPTQGQEQQVEGINAAAPHYFRVLERAHEFSNPGTPVPTERYPRSQSPTSSSTHADDDDIAPSDLPAMGYYRRFFKEECRLGIGAEGSVYLATHVISGNALGTYAVKKIAVGTSKTYLVRMLREVRLLETLRHPNIIPYYHSWVDETRFSSFGPPIMALHVLMMYASAGNLDVFIQSRSHQAGSQSPLSARDVGDAEEIDLLPKAERIKAFKRRRESGHGNRRQESRGVLLLGIDEILRLFDDVVQGLAFLHASSILHLDLKCSNVLLHWEDGQVIPKAMLSDFGTSEEMLRGRRDRTGHTGTMEYMAPETIVVDTMGNWRPSDSHADMWSLGMILHKMIFLRLPYNNSDDLAALHGEILLYGGFMVTPEIVKTCERRHIPRDLVFLLAKLLDLSPDRRPSAERIMTALGHLRPASVAGAWSKLWGAARGSPESLKSEKVRERRSKASSSPVRSILALPSPPSTHSATKIKPLTRHSPKGNGSARILCYALFVSKILSTQPALVGLSMHPLAAMVLTVLALVDVLMEGPSIQRSLVLAAIHVSVIFAVWRDV